MTFTGWLLSLYLLSYIVKNKLELADWIKFNLLGFTNKQKVYVVSHKIITQKVYSNTEWVKQARKAHISAFCMEGHVRT